jgi:hypothetical protein
VRVCRGTAVSTRLLLTEPSHPYHSLQEGRTPIVVATTSSRRLYQLVHSTP